MEAPPDEHQDLLFASDDDSEEEASPTPAHRVAFQIGLRLPFQTALNVYY